jgi:hypothetical protein
MKIKFLIKVHLLIHRVSLNTTQIAEMSTQMDDVKDINDNKEDEFQSFTEDFDQCSLEYSKTCQSLIETEWRVTGILLPHNDEKNKDAVLDFYKQLRLERDVTEGKDPFEGYLFVSWNSRVTNVTVRVDEEGNVKLGRLRSYLAVFKEID